MIIVELSQIFDAPPLLPVAGFVVSGKVKSRTVATYWTDTLNTPFKEQTGVVRINRFISGITESYARVISVEDCKAQEKTFFFDSEIEQLTVHYEHNHAWYTSQNETGTLEGYCDKKRVTLDGLPYLPAILSVPTIRQAQDFSKYSKLTFIKGSIVFNNADGILDENVLQDAGTTVQLRLLQDKPGVVDYYEKTKRELVAVHRFSEKPQPRWSDASCVKGSKLKCFQRKSEDGRRRIKPSQPRNKRLMSLRAVDIRVSARQKRIAKVWKRHGASDVVDLGHFYIENYKASLQEISIDVQDLRKKQDVQIPSENYTKEEYPEIEPKYYNKPIPIMYGKCAATYATPLNGQSTAGDVIYRQAIALEELGSVYVLNEDDIWEQVAQEEMVADLPNGTFTVSSTKARKPRSLNDSDTPPRKCKVLNSKGIPNASVADVIVDLHDRYLGAIFTNSNYDRKEWRKESAALKPVGVFWDKKIKLYEAIRQLQQSANIRFRYSFTTDGKRTLRVDDPGRESTWRIRKEEIQNIDKLPIETEREELTTIVNVDYNYNNVDKSYSRETDRTYEQEIFISERQKPERTFGTFLTQPEEAQERAKYEAERRSRILRTVKLDLIGLRFFSMRIYDTIDVELTPSFINLQGEFEGRKYLGKWKAQVLSIAPNEKGMVNKITAVLIDEIVTRKET